MFKKLNLMNKQFGRLIVLEKSNLGRYKWLCLCDCGNEVTVTTSSLRSGNTKSCGCLHKEKSSVRISKLNKQKKIDLIGLKFGRLSVLKEYNKDESNVIKWACICSCGNVIHVSTGNLRNGSTKSCGCLAREKLIKFNKRIYSAKTRSKMSVARQGKWSGEDNPKYNKGYLISGPNNPSWKGGISCEPYCFEWSSKEFKDFIKERDGYSCLNPDCWKTSRRLSIHHIDYNKKNCDPSNLITLCTSCNSRANKDREWHTSWYQTIMYMRGCV